MTLSRFPLPSRPEAVLRVGVAGSRDLGTAEAAVAASLTAVLSAIGNQFAASTHSSEAAPTGRAGRFYSANPPCLRLVTGLAEGADALVANALDALPVSNLRTELAAVLPFGSAAYRQSRSENFRPIFDAAAGALCLCH